MKTNWSKASVWVLVAVGINFFPSIETGAGDKKEKGKVTLCHKGQTMELPEAAVQAHLNHGDTLGPCSVTPSQNR